LYAASTNDAALYDIQTGEKIRRFRGHRGVVNSVQVAREGGRMVTAGDDGRICIWDPRQKKATTVLSNDGFAVSGSRVGKAITSAKHAMIVYNSYFFGGRPSNILRKYR